MIDTAALDVLDFDRHQPVIDAAFETLDGLDLVLIAHGSLPDQRTCEQSAEQTRNEFEINATCTISLLTHLANNFESQGAGTIAVISSVAGDRGRQSNYVYGSAKGAVTIFLQGLRNRLHQSGVNVLTIKPGFVDTPMTAQMAKGSLWAQPDQVARGIVKAVERRRHTVYVPGFWLFVMLVIRSVPEILFKRLSL